MTRLLRWQQDSGWCFESLGIEGREHANAAALEYWTAALSAASSQPTEPVQIGTFRRLDGWLHTHKIATSLR